MCSICHSGTYAVARGEPFTWGTPPCIGKLSEAEMTGMVKPYMQFGRQAGVPLFAITSGIVPTTFSTIKLVAAEFNTAKILVTTEDYDPAGPKMPSFVKLYQDDGMGGLSWVENDFNQFVMDDLGVEAAAARGDVRLFTYSDGSAGAFIERTGKFYKLEEIFTSPTSSPTAAPSNRPTQEVCSATILLVSFFLFHPSN